MTGFQSMFAPDLVACIREGRHPTVQELCRVADRIQREIQGYRPAFDWRSGANSAIDKTFAFRVAQTALTGNEKGKDVAPSVDQGTPSLQP